MKAITACIIYENNDFVIVNKPHGIAMQDQGDALGLINLLRAENSTPDYFPVHRLDQPTSGLLLVAKNKAANSALSTAFEHRQVTKVYWAVSDKKPKRKQGAVIGDMHRARGGSWKLSRNKDKPARTHFFSFALDHQGAVCAGDDRRSARGGYRAFLLRPTTGKTHQLRVALKSLGAAILGDERYGGEKSDRLYLHASYLAFNFNGNAYEFSLPPDNGALFLTPSFQNLCGQPDIISRQVWPC